MMNDSTLSIIANTSALVSLIVETDSNHAKAIQMLDSYDFQISGVVIPNDVFAECINVLGRKLGHKLAYEGAEKIINSNVFSVVDIDEDLRQSALTKFKDQSNSVSYTDCMVMALADIWETKQIFGFDEAFPKNGYITPK